MQIPEHAKVYKIKVFPDAHVDEVVETGEHAYQISVRAPASENRANERTILLLARELHVEPKTLRIIAGHQKQSKTVVVYG